jgi:site-specific DNA recombinase
MKPGRKKKESANPDSKSSIRCAVYTRKSTEEGLDQDFNSLDAQREAAEAFIESQKGEGWACLPARYDDGGFSGGNTERPALKRLLADVEAGLVDCIVVYKVDRLSRSLLDFAQIIGALERRRVSFVSVTQQFNTTHSMGRLTLNILLSFAQFEREIIAERTRDKMCAARRRGKWTGGMPVLGYDVDPAGGRLVVNELEACRVREIFSLYLERRSLTETAREFNGRGWTTKQWVTKKGRRRKGREFDKGNLFRLLTNRVYIGEVLHKDQVYKGEHPDIVDAEVWRRVQTLLRRNGSNGGKETRNKYGALLRGILYCAPCGTAMTHAYTAKGGNRRYRYYVCSRAQKQGWDVCPTKSLPAEEIERFVVDRIRCIGTDPGLVAETLGQARAQNENRLESLEKERKILQREIKRYDEMVRRLIGGPRVEGRGMDDRTAQLADLDDRIRASEQRVTKIREDMADLAARAVDEMELASALTAFHPLWKSLVPREQAGIIRLLLERVAYDAGKGTVAITFRPSGIRTLAQEALTDSSRSRNAHY